MGEVENLLCHVLPANAQAIPGQTDQTLHPLANQATGEQPVEKP